MKVLKRLFCKHSYSVDSATSSIRSKRVGDDNFVIVTSVLTCSECGEEKFKDKVEGIERGWYKENVK